MSNDAVEYAYINVGFGAAERPEAVEYAYINIGSFSITTVLGRVVGIMHLDRHATEYAYMNVT